MKRGFVPERTCRSCGLKRPRSELLRFVVVEGRLTEDRHGRMPGRGIYCCQEGTCRSRLATKKKILKAVGASTVDELTRKGALNEQSSCV